MGVKKKVGGGGRDLQYRVVYLGIRNAVLWDSERKHCFVVTIWAARLLMRLAVGGTTVGEDVSEYVHWTELAGGNTCKYMYELRLQLGDRGVTDSNGQGWWRLGPGRGVRVCSHAWNEAGPPDAVLSKLVNGLDHCQDVEGRWDDRRMMEFRFRMKGRSVIALGCGAQFTTLELERLALRPGTDVQPRVRRRKVPGTGVAVNAMVEAERGRVAAECVAPATATAGIAGVARIPAVRGVAPGVPAIRSGG